ncbi:MAG TPA: UDP-N-acetylmuramate dehydrogenase [Ignavibacteria bacterium]
MLIVKENILLSGHTNIQLGGNAEYFCECINEEQLLECLAFVKEKNLKVQILGGGSNVIFSDEGYDGMILKTAMKNITISGKGGSDIVLVTAEAGMAWDDFVRICVSQCFAGVECLSGIPGTVGATPIQNVGAYGQEVSSTISEVTTIEISTLNKVVFSNSDCRFGYRQSRFKSEDAGKYIITEVKFLLKRNGEPEIKYPELKEHIDNLKLKNPDTKDLASKEDKRRKFSELKLVRNAVIELRKNKSMVVDENDPDSISCGSFFINPVLNMEEYLEFESRIKNSELRKTINEIPHFLTERGVKIPAAWLIENAGFQKGYRRKGAGISSKHTLAIINSGGNTKDVLDLAKEIESGVNTLFGITLIREPIVVH